MTEQIKKALSSLKEFWEQQPPKRQKIIKYSAAGAVALAVVLTLWLSLSGGSYKVVFPGMSQTEASEVYATLKGMGVDAEIDKDGNVKVPSSDWDELQYELSTRGYPQTTLSYDTFSSMSGFTTTEFEKRVALTYQLQDRLQTTLRRWDGIEDVSVIINVPEQSQSVWNQYQQQASSASVTVKTKPGYSLSPEQVSAIKNHTASAVPQLIAKNVVVTDAATGTEPPSLEDANYGYSTSRFEFERELEAILENNVRRLLAPTYGIDGVIAVAKVTVDYDKMVTERREVLPQDDGHGVVSHKEESYTVGGNVPASGIVGEENNTDIPEYPDLEELDGSEITDFDRVIDYDIGYILTQIEKGEPVLKDASIAVIVKDAYFDRDKEDLLVDLISKSVNLDPDYIRVASLSEGTIQTGGDEYEYYFLGLPLRTAIMIGGAILAVVIILAIVTIVIMRRRKKKREEDERIALELEEEQRQKNLEQEIADHKRMLMQEAQASSNPKENAITEEVRMFAHRNPEITANLLRSLMREE